jgi:D-alanine-D-alanine ligase
MRIAVLFGGPSREHDVSLGSGTAVAKALAGAGHEVLPVCIERDGVWTLTGGPTDTLPGGPELPAQPSSTAGTLRRLEQSAPGAPEVVFVALHGAYGEDGTVQGLLEALGLPYTGSGVAASALAMDKERTKEVIVHHGLKTPPWIALHRNQWSGRSAELLDRIEAELGLPAIVKPPRDGSSFGVTVVAERDALRAAIEGCLDGPDGRALIEQRIDGTELTCPVLGNVADTLQTLPLIEIVPDADRAFFDFAAKYEGASREICPARVSEDVAERVREAARTAHLVIGCAGLSRSDFMLDADGELWFLETNTVPGMTEQSLCPLSAAAAGMTFAELCERLAELARQ